MSDYKSNFGMIIPHGSVKETDLLDCVRRGNFVMYNGERVMVTGVRVTDLDLRIYFGRLVDLPTGKHYVQVGYNDSSKFTPIVLTEEILLEFGFKQVESILLNKSLFCMPTFKDGKPEYKISIGTAGGGYMTSCAHLHTLQNLYFSMYDEELRKPFDYDNNNMVWKFDNPEIK